MRIHETQCERETILHESQQVVSLPLPSNFILFRLLLLFFVCFCGPIYNPSSAHSRGLPQRRITKNRPAKALEQSSVHPYLKHVYILHLSTLRAFLFFFFAQAHVCVGAGLINRCFSHADVLHCTSGDTIGKRRTSLLLFFFSPVATHLSFPRIPLSIFVFPLS